MTLGDKASSLTTVTHHRGTISQCFILFQENISNYRVDKNILQKSLKYFRCSKGHNSKSRLYRQSIWTVEMINSLWISPPRKSVRARQDLHSVDWAVFKSSSNQKLRRRYKSMIYNVLTMNQTTKRSIVQCTCDQQRLGSVSASTHYIKQASWIARSPKKVHFNFVIH